ncbi:MAG: hypothetical protein ACLPV8_20775 [Steroidobacteraceae bacterium]
MWKLKKEPSGNLSAAEFEEIARKTFAQIASRFPNLRMTEDQGKNRALTRSLPKCTNGHDLPVEKSSGVRYAIAVAVEFQAPQG